MLYAILCYNSEEVVSSWSKQEDDEVIGRLIKVTEKIAAKGQLGPVARLQGTRAAKTLRKGGGGGQPYMVLDGPFAETKEQFLGFYLVDCANIDEVVKIAEELAAANRGPSSYEIRPVQNFMPGKLG
jgi:hypothetical protein